MRTTLATLAISGILACSCSAQESATSVATNATASDTSGPGVPKAYTPVAAATRDRQVIEATAQYELLTQLAKEHSKRAEETPRDQGRHQWESELVRELSDRATVLQSLLNNTNQERLVSLAPPNSLIGTTNGPNPEAIAYLGALVSRRSAVQEELAAAGAAANLYAIQVATNNNYSDISNIHYLIWENGYSVKQLQRELSDLDLKNLEFRALRKQ